jgi:hypothetical protein
LEISFNILQGNNLVVAVFCNEISAACPSVDFIQDNERVKQVIIIRACALEQGNQNAVNEQLACSNAHVNQMLTGVLSYDTTLIDAIITDWNAPMVVGRFVETLMESLCIDEDNIFYFSTVASKTEIWRRRLLDNVRNFVDFDPLNRAHILLNTTTSSLEMGVVSSGDSDFFHHLTKAVSLSQDQFPDVKLEIQSILKK